MIKSSRLCSLVVCAACLSAAMPPAGAATSGDGAPAMVEVTPGQSDGPLVNPGMGIYLYGTLNPDDMPADAWFSKVISIGYFRDDWAVLEPEAPAEYRFDEYFGPIFDLWVNRWGKRVAFRFMSENMHSRRQYVTPKWVFGQGVPGVHHKGLYTEDQVDPVFWDERYLAIQERFIADLGKYLDGRPGLEFIDIGSIGEWGEMHLARWTPDQLVETGYAEEKYIAAYRRIIDAFARAFPHTRVFLNVGDYDAINDYAAIRGLHFRQDGLTPSGPSADVGNRFYRSYARRGVICNYELHSGYYEMKQKGWGIKETFARGLEDPISYLHINLMSYHDLLEPPAEVREAVTDAARRIGFRFALARLRYNGTVHLDGQSSGRLVLEQTWKNLGVAPCYDSYALRWSLVDAAGQAVAQCVTFPRRPTTLWWPGDEVVLKNLATIPADIPPGSYRLRVEMLKPEQAGLAVQLALSGPDGAGRYDLGEVTVQRGPRRSEMVYEQDFQTGAGGWQGTRGITVRADVGGRDGGGCLLVSGREPGASWNYAWVRLAAPVLPYSRYRLSCWVKVDSIEPGLAPYLKLGVSDAQGKWITNLNTELYDLSRPGTWQRLVAYADTPAEAATGDLAIEKGVLEAAISAAIRIADVKLELLESP
jgi:hypothetical protein